MKKFLITILAFFIPVLFVLAGLEYMVRKAPNEYQYKAEWMEKNADRVETLILGTSHAFYGINPSYLGPNAFSLAASAQSLQYDEFLFFKYAPKCTNLKTVILPISYFTLFSGDMEDGSEWWRAINYKVYMDCPYHSSFSKYNFFISNSEPFRAKLTKIIKGNNIIECDSLGFGYPIYRKSTPSLDEASVAAWVKLHTAKDFSCVEKNKQHILKIVEYCKSNHIRLIIVTTPTWKTYYERLNPPQLNVMKEIISQLTSKNNAIYLNYMQDVRFVATDFTDCNHMSCDGAQKLSSLIDSSINGKY